MVKKRQTIITIIGNIGSGKSTLAKELSRHLNARLINADNLYLINPFFSSTIKNRKRWSLTSDLWFLYKRVNIINKLPSDRKNKYIVVDSGLPMSWIYAHSRIKSGHYTKNEWLLYQTYNRLLTSTIPQVDILIELHASTSFLLQRIKHRGRKFEIKYFNKDYIDSVSISLNQYKKQMINPPTKVISINVEKIDFKSSKQIHTIADKIHSL